MSESVSLDKVWKQLTGRNKSVFNPELAERLKILFAFLRTNPIDYHINNPMYETFDSLDTALLFLSGDGSVYGQAFEEFLSHEERPKEILISDQLSEWFDISEGTGLKGLKRRVFVKAFYALHELGYSSLLNQYESMVCPEEGYQDENKSDFIRRVRAFKGHMRRYNLLKKQGELWYNKPIKTKDQSILNLISIVNALESHFSMAQIGYFESEIDNGAAAPDVGFVFVDYSKATLDMCHYVDDFIGEAGVSAASTFTYELKNNEYTFRRVFDPQLPYLLSILNFFNYATLRFEGRRFKITGLKTISPALYLYTGKGLECVCRTAFGKRRWLFGSSDSPDKKVTIQFDGLSLKPISESDELDSRKHFIFKLTRHIKNCVVEAGHQETLVLQRISIPQLGLIFYTWDLMDFKRIFTTRTSYKELSWVKVTSIYNAFAEHEQPGGISVLRSGQRGCNKKRRKSRRATVSAESNSSI